MADNQTMGLRDLALLILLSMIWGGVFFAAEIALEDIRPFTLVASRLVLAATALWAIILISGRRFPKSAYLLAGFLVMGTMNNAIPFSLIFWGQTEITGGLASILNATTPLWAIVMGVILSGDERLTKGRVAGVLLGLCGVAVLIGPDALEGVGGSVLGQLAVLGAACCYGFAVVFGRRRFKGLDPVVTAAGQLSASSLIMLPVALLADAPWTASLSWAGAGAVLHVALAGTALAFFLYFTLLSSAGATNTATVTFLVPISAILLGAVFLGETLAWNAFAGMALIFTGLALIDGRLATRLGRRAPRRAPR